MDRPMSCRAVLVTVRKLLPSVEPDVYGKDSSRQPHRGPLLAALSPGTNTLDIHPLVNTLGIMSRQGPGGPQDQGRWKNTY
jgi:hypothetical protein